MPVVNRCSTTSALKAVLTEDESIPNDMFEPLYPGAIITTCAAYFAIMTHAITNKLSYSSIENLLPTILFKLRKKKRVCPECERILGKGESCHGNSGYLIQVTIEKALKTVVYSELISEVCIQVHM